MQISHHKEETFSLHLNRDEFLDLVYLIRAGISDGCPAFSTQVIIDFAVANGIVSEVY